jgi:hypothetical protein
VPHDVVGYLCHCDDCLILFTMKAKTRARGACIGPVLRDPAPTFRAGVRVPVTTRSWGLGPRVSIPLGIEERWVTVFPA